jgi:processive 1,2-diacylglycerol beta-glucosyltransferase
MSQKNLLILSVSAGSGHVRAAEALRATAQQDFLNVRVMHLDILQFVPEHFRKLYSETYLDVVEHHPSVWGYLYRFADRQKTDSLLTQLRMRMERLNTHKLKRAILALEADHIICTHFLPASLLARMIQKDQLPCSVWVVDTDFDIHNMWIYAEMQGYFAAGAEVAWRMQDRGVPADRIHITGIPIMPAFRQKPERAICAQELGLDPAQFTVLLMSGGSGLGGTEQLAARLLKLNRKMQIVVIAGKNQELLATLQEMAPQHPQRLFPLGFTNTIERVMAAADVAITKSGGLTTSECLALSLPMIVISPIPGQEERNADYLLEHGAALKAYDAAGLEYRVCELCDHPEKLQDMRQRMHDLGKPEAARNILRVVLGAGNAA